MTNRIATSSLNKMTLVEAFKRQVQLGLSDTDYTPDISHLHTIGCKTYVNTPKERRVKSTKLVPHAKEGYLVRFKGSKIYCVYLPRRAQKIVQTLYCVFNESEPNNPENLETSLETSQSEDWNDLTQPPGEIIKLQASQSDQSEYSNNVNIPEITH
jgi:hypothetical protein